MTSWPEIMKRLQDAGFEVSKDSSRGNAVAVKKANCIYHLEKNQNGEWRPASAPFFLIGGKEFELEDRGYQKFWLSGETRVPIRKKDLETLHRFDAELREVLGIQSLYNESLGSTCARTAYDRLMGRPEQ